MLAYAILAVPGLLGLYSGPNRGPAQVIFATLIVVVALTLMLAIVSVQVPHEPVRDADLPGVKPPDTWGPGFDIPVAVLVAYVLVTHVSLDYSHPIWFGIAERLTRPVAEFLPGIARTTRQLRAVGFEERAMEVGHYLALAWVLAAIGMMIGFTRQWFAWTDANWLWGAARVRRYWERLTPGRQAWAQLGLCLGSCLLAAGPFIGEMRHTGRYAYDFSGDEVEFFVGLWYNYLLPFGLSGGTIVIALYVNFWRHARSLPGTNDIQNIP